MEYLNLIEKLLIDNGIDIEDYSDPLRGISKYESIESAILYLIRHQEKPNYCTCSRCTGLPSAEEILDSFNNEED